MTENTEKRYPGNSHNRREVEAEPSRTTRQKVIKGEAKIKVPVGRRILNSFTGDDGRTVGEHVLFDIIIPSIKDMIVDAGKDALERAFFGTSSGSRSSRSRGGNSWGGYGNNKTRYSEKYRGRNFERDERDEPRQSRRGRASHNFEEITLETRGDAEEVLDALRDSLEEFNQATVADLYDFVGISADAIDRVWGWEDLREASVKRLRSDLYVLDLPNTIRLD